MTNNKRKKVIFMGSPEFTLPVLIALNEHFDLTAVYTTPPPERSSNRKDPKGSAVYEWAKGMNVPVRMPETLRDETVQQELLAWNADAVVVYAYGKIIPETLINQLEFINIHPSFLPEFRGPTPIPSAIRAGKSETGVCIMRIAKEVDAGPILACSTPVAITNETTPDYLFQKLTQHAAEMLVHVLKNPPTATPQPSEGITYCYKPKENENLINWNDSAVQIQRDIRAFTPKPGAYFLYHNGKQVERVKVFESHVEERPEEAKHICPGFTLDDKLLVACGEKALRPTMLQPANGKLQSASDFLNGRRIKENTPLFLIPNHEHSEPMRYKLTIEYDGTPFVGWQRQEKQLSVQGVLEDALKTALRAPITLFGSGRTDAGVHALGQVAHFEIDTPCDMGKLRESLNALVRPHPITIRTIDATTDDFHARFSAKQRTYIYKIQNTPWPPAINRDRVWWIRTPLDLAAMQSAAALMIGNHDFSTFRASECQAKSPIKTLDDIQIIKTDQMIEVWVRARSFLHHQVRNMVGSIVNVGTGKWSVTDFADAFSACDRTRGGETAPAQGLYFAHVIYDSE